METPPQFMAPPPPAKRSNTVLIVVLIVLGVCAVCCGGVFYVGYGFWNKVKSFAGCSTHYPLVRRAMADYAAAHGGKLPDADKWQDEIVPYYLNARNSAKEGGGGIIDLGDANGDLGCKADNGSPATGIAFNDQLAGISVTKARENPSTVLLYEVKETGRNLHKPYTPLAGMSAQTIMGAPRAWITLPVTGNINGQQSFVADPKTGGL